MKISIIIPVLNDAKPLKALLYYLKQHQTPQVEIIVVDGGSDDGCFNIAKKTVNTAIQTNAGRALQMNAGAAVAKGEYLWFLHADSSFLHNPIPLLLSNNHPWARFKIKLSGRAFIYRIIETFMNVRSCKTGIVTGDHAMLISKQLFTKVQGVDEIALMEDIALSKKLKPYRLKCFKHVVVTSARRWQNNGVVKTVLLMWWLRLQYFFGASPACLHKQYYKK